MNRLSFAAIFAVSAIGFTQIASAADMPRKAPPPAPVPVYNWTGWYVGGNIGGAWGDRNVTVSPNDPFAFVFIDQVVAVHGGAFDSTPSFNTSGVIGGLQFGYNWQFNRNWLIGLETDFNWADVKGSSLAVTGGNFSQAESFDERLKWFGTVRGRLGYLPIDKLLMFVTGGFAYGRIEHHATFTTLGPLGIGQSQGPGFSFSCVVLGQPCFTGTSTSTGTGWTIGGGFEYALWNNLTIKGEYIYVSLANPSVTMAATGVLNAGDTPSTFHVDFGRANFNVARVGLNYRFN